MRKYYIDNIRILGILLLFPFHTSMIYNGFESFYIHGPVIRTCNDFILLSSIWFMPLLFLLAGMSSYWALQKRTWKEYLKERFFKLLVPFFFGVILTVPVQTYYAERFHNHYQGGYFHQYLLFFSKSTDLTGYSGGFTPGHFWFLLYLLIISFLALPIMIKTSKVGNRFADWFFGPVRLLFLFIFPFIASAVLDIGGKSLGQFFAVVLIGFLISREEKNINMVEEYRRFYLVLSILLSTLLYVLFYTIGWKSGFSPAAIAFSALRHLIMWTSILTIVGFGKRYLNVSNRISSYFGKAAFPIYIFHQTWLVVTAYYVFKATNVLAVQFLSIMLLSFILSIVTYEIFRRIVITRFMFGMKR